LKGTTLDLIYDYGIHSPIYFHVRTWASTEDSTGKVKEHEIFLKF
jgi:hypothetical protein